MRRRSCHSLTPTRGWLTGLLAAAILIPGSVVLAGQGQDARPSIEVTDSQRLHLYAVRLRTNDQVLILRGRAARPIPSRGFIPGAVRVTLLDASGQSLATRVTKPMRPNNHSTFGDFFVQIPTPDGQSLDGARVLVAAEHGS